MIDLKGELFSTKNHKQILRNRATGKPFIATATRSKAAEAPLVLQLNALRREWEGLVSAKLLPLHLHFKIRRATHRRFDYINIVQGLLDVMVKAKWLEDDSADHVIPSFAPYVVDKLNPGVTIVLL